MQSLKLPKKIVYRWLLDSSQHIHSCSHQEMADYTFCCNLIIYIIQFLDMVLCVAGIIVWGTQRKECTPAYVHPHHPDVPSHLLAIVILKIMIHAVEIIKNTFKTPAQDADTTERSVKESIVAILCTDLFFTAYHLIPLVWLCVVAFPNIDSATFQTHNHCINDIYIFSVIFTLSMVIMIISRIVLPIQECLCKM